MSCRESIVCESRCKRDKALAVYESLATLTCTNLATFLQHSSTAGYGLLCVSPRDPHLLKDGIRERGGTETAQPRFLGHLSAASRANHVVYLTVEARDRTCRRERESGGLQVESSMQGWDDGYYA